jgi:hypothetical protein
MLMLLLFDFNFLVLAPIAPVEAVVGEDLIVINHKLYPDPGLDRVIVMGEVVNSLGAAISGVNLSITFYDEGAHELKKAYCAAFLGVTPPGRRSAFKYPFENEEIENFTYYDVKVSSYTISESSKPTGFSIVTATAILYPDRTEVKGTVENLLSSSLRFLNVFALLYDENGFIAATDSDLTLVELKPGAADSFSCVTRAINDTFNVVQCIITGESNDYGVEREKVITSAKSQDEGFKYTIAAAMIIGIAALALSLILLRKRYKKRKQSIRSKLSRDHSTSRISKHLNS